MKYAWWWIMAVPDNYLVPPPSNANGNGGRWQRYILEWASIFTRPDIYYSMGENILLLCKYCY